MSPIHKPSRPPIMLLAVIAALLLIGCAQERTGRIGIGETTPSEANNPKILPVALTEASDKIAEQLAHDLADVPKVHDIGKPITVLVGDIQNKTGIVSSNDFEFVRSRLRNNLLNNGYVKGRLKFVENRARMSRIAERERVADEGFYADPPDYDPKTTFALNGDFYRIHRGKVNQYYLEFQLVHFGNNEIVWANQRYDVKQITD